MAQEMLANADLGDYYDEDEGNQSDEGDASRYLD